MVDIYEMKTRCDLLQQICPKQTFFGCCRGSMQAVHVRVHCASMFMCNNMHVQGLHCKHVTCTMCNEGTFVHLVKLDDAGWSSEAGGCSWWQKPAAWSSCFRLQSAAICTEWLSMTLRAMIFKARVTEAEAWSRDMVPSKGASGRPGMHIALDGVYILRWGVYLLRWLGRGKYIFR